MMKFVMDNGDQIIAEQDGNSAERLRVIDSTGSTLPSDGGVYYLREPFERGGPITYLRLPAGRHDPNIRISTLPKRTTSVIKRIEPVIV
ncbi:MAG TPA: hypothetical protein VF597_02925 [Candidatus Saccharimonadales bacterium]|jgi:hypothetical protein